ncbi:hypothetical protein [Oligoflexus tunisiensis]|uniref:hypothetical protein n=1 Tax=Oligoflexus tunisiensis TaxID=708132 RepID=UPI00114CB028|nr:hypothetical protein [Oligoflexus tunisiensis]
MRYVWAILCALMISGPVTAQNVNGGMSGGTGIGGLIDEITQEIQAILKVPIKIDEELIRRLIMRLCTHGEAQLVFGNTIIHIKWKHNHDIFAADQIEITVTTPWDVP